MAATIDVFLSNFWYDLKFSSRVFGETKSRATVHLEPEGMITAKIETPEETYHIEPSWRHIADSEPETMIAYKESDINFR